MNLSVIYSIMGLVDTGDKFMFIKTQKVFHYIIKALGEADS